MITASLLDADWAARRLTGRGLGRDAFDPTAADPDRPANFTTSIVVLPPSIATRLHATAATIAGAQAGHYVQPVETIHTTVCGPIDPDRGPSVDRALDDLRDVAITLTGCRLRIVRLGVGDTSVFAGLEVSGADLGRARRELGVRWGVEGRPGPMGWIAGRLFWANLVRFGVPPSASVFDAFGRARRVRSVAFDVEGIDLVRTNRSMAPAQTSWLGRVPLRG